MSASESKVPKAHAGEKIIVASKLEMALQIQHRQFREVVCEDHGTKWTERRSYGVGPVIILAGIGFPNGPTPEGMERPRMMSRSPCASSRTVRAPVARSLIAKRRVTACVELANQMLKSSPPLPSRLRSSVWMR